MKYSQVLASILSCAVGGGIESSKPKNRGAKKKTVRSHSYTRVTKPHQGNAEIARRKRQIEKGMLQHV